ncbi:hypothetical protein [Salinibacter ruber]|uniref:hypothetical protein n=1 Tax=Salinibacter ruber TaxID=146919 RepID=UPI00216986E4|nr:hypothetical protein [Salinibacter ruber]MCS4198970.1 hypothetical protein [Salinibacter ruber]
MPWRVREVDWTDQKAKRAVIWLSETLDTPISRLEASDYYQNQLHSLVHRYDDVNDLAWEVFEDLRQRITYRENLLSDERVFIFSPHPDDDVISMGACSTSSCPTATTSPSRT